MGKNQIQVIKMVEKKKKVVKKKPVAKPKAVQKKKPVIAKAVVKKELECIDKKCPVHSGLKTHGRVFVGVIINNKMKGTVNVEWPRQYYLPKYERYEKRRSRVKAHNPACIAAKLGDRVKIAECRPISKTVNFVVIEVLNESNKS